MVRTDGKGVRPYGEQENGQGAEKRVERSGDGKGRKEMERNGWKRETGEGSVGKVKGRPPLLF